MTKIVPKKHIAENQSVGKIENLKYVRFRTYMCDFAQYKTFQKTTGII